MSRTAQVVTNQVVREGRSGLQIVRRFVASVLSDTLHSAIRMTFMVYDVVCDIRFVLFLSHVVSFGLRWQTGLDLCRRVVR